VEDGFKKEVMRLTQKRLARIKSVAGSRQQGIIVLENIFDPHNAAAVLRTADAFGFQKVYFIQGPPITNLSGRKAKIIGMNEILAKSGSLENTEFVFEKGKRFNPRKIGKVSSASANKWLDFEVFGSTKECFSKLKRQRYEIIGTILDGKAKSIYKTKFTNPKIALVLGNEHAGLSADAIKLSDAHVYIPMRGFIQSLNLSVTAAICMYEMSRQRKSADKKFLLSKSEQNKLVKNWKTK
jgi:tRNA (guanosine-2'-O-)-methyltransferase